VSSPLWTSADDAALDALIEQRVVFVPEASSLSELDPAQAVFESLAALLRRVRVTVEGSFDPIQFKAVYTAAPNAWDRATFPACAIDDISTNQYQVTQCTPWTDRGRDIESGGFALWQVGEDTGLAKVTVVAATNPEARALAESVRQCLFSDIDNRRGVRLPMPQAFIPPPFRGMVSPVCRLLLAEGGGSITDVEGPKEGLYRVEVRFTWQAQRISARPIIDAMNVGFDVTTTGTTLWVSSARSPVDPASRPCLQSRAS
jgi:hypothetical protein